MYSCSNCSGGSRSGRRSNQRFRSTGVAAVVHMIPLIGVYTVVVAEVAVVFSVTAVLLLQ